MQTFERDSDAVELAIRAAEHFGCDGIVNVQTRDDASGQPHLLEINLRYSGGIGYTRETGVNLRIFEEDRLRVESQRPERLPLDLSLEAHIPADKSSIAYRRGLKKMGFGAFFLV